MGTKGDVGNFEEVGSEGREGVEEVGSEGWEGVEEVGSEGCEGGIVEVDTEGCEAVEEMGIEGGIEKVGIGYGLWGVEEVIQVEIDMVGSDADCEGDVRHTDW